MGGITELELAWLARVCEALDLGTLRSEPRPVTGGLLHRTWRLATTRGVFAVKQLNPSILARPGVRGEYRRSERVAALVAAAGLPAVAALTRDGDPLQDVGAATVLVYDWVDGETLPPSAADPARARRIGEILGRIHSLDLRLPDLVAPNWSGEWVDWPALAYRARERGIPWAEKAVALLPDLAAWTNSCREAGDVLSRSLVVSHRDLDQKNVLWRDARTPALIDWEGAGLTNPTMELASVALYWSGQTVGRPDRAAFDDVLKGYRSTGMVMRDRSVDALWGYAGAWLEWLAFNMHRSLGEEVSDPEERQLGVRQTSQTLALLRRLTASLETWAEWLDGE